jgi:hypothetical protein
LSKNVTTDQGLDEDCSLDIFGIITNTSDLAKELVSKELLILKSFKISSSMVRET